MRIAWVVLLGVLSWGSSVSAKVTSTDVTCLRNQRCTKLSNGTVDVVVTRDVGPRVLSYGFAGAANVFAEMPPQGESIDLTKFTLWGGHRLWHAPEQAGRSYVPDNAPPQITVLAPGHVRFTAAPEAPTHLQKEIEVRLDPTGTRVTVIHRLKNVGPWAIEAAPWAISVLRGGGVALVPNEPVRPHPEALLPVRPMALWAYTNLADKRFSFGPKFTRLRTDSAAKAPQKVGFGNHLGWVAYANAGTLFVKRMPFFEGAIYTDFGSNTEVYTAGDFIEVESLAPLRPIAAGGSAEHTETWFLYKGVNVPEDDVALAAVLAPLLASAVPAKP
ncbi:MAG: hypothetical protein SF187_17945 [Deltaproteobacteria bacterium]|nr:hypothetical protein [Deltaproteobacteria bacterium]